MTVYINGTTGYSGPVGTIGDLTTTGNTTLGDASGDTLTLNGNTASIPNGLSFTNGNIGIGVSPSAWGSGLKAIQIGGSNGYVSYNNINGGYLYWNMYNDGSNNKTLATGNIAAYGLNTSGAHVWFNGTGTIGATSSLTQAMTLDTSGRLLVGTTTSPSSSNMRAVFQSPNASGNGGIQLAYNDAGGGGGAIFSNSTGLNFFTYTGVVGSETYTQRATIDSSGNLGIGVTSPNRKLTIGDAGIIGLYDSGNSNQATLQMASSGLEAYVGSSKYIAFGTASVERARINSSGNLLVGTTSSVNNWNNSLIKMRVENGIQFGSYSCIAEDLFDADSLGICVDSTENLCFGQYTTAGGSYTERARIDSSGNLLVGTTDAGDTTGNGIKLWPNGGIPRISMVGNSVSSGQYPFMIRSSSNNTWRMYIDWAGNIYAQNTAITSLSDVRLKENIRDLETGLDKVLALQPRRFDWKEGKGQDKKDVAGFIAQEVEAVLPELVTTGLDEDESGDKYKMLAPAMLIPTLVKAIQEQQAIIESLKARLDAANL